MLVFLNMTSNSATFTNLRPSKKWNTATLERSNLVYRNGADAGVLYNIHIDEFTDNFHVCDSGSILRRDGTFIVGNEPFNAQEKLTVNNPNPGDKLEKLTVKVYDMSSGDLATISNPFYLQIRFD